MESAKSRFLRYVTYYTTSDEFTGTSPSTERQKDLGRVLMQEDMTARTLTDALFKLLDERGEMLAALEAYPVKDGTQAVLELIEDARKK